MIIKYPAIIEPQEPSGLLVTFPDLNEAFTEGDNMEEALFNAQEVLNLTLAGRIDEGMDIPKPSNISNAVMVSPSTSIQSALLVRFNRNGTSLSDLARKLETSWPAAKRLEDPKHSPTLKQLERAAHALGKRLILSFE